MEMVRGIKDRKLETKDGEGRKDKERMGRIGEGRALTWRKRQGEGKR